MLRKGVSLSTSRRRSVREHETTTTVDAKDRDQMLIPGRLAAAFTRAKTGSQVSYVIILTCGHTQCQRCHFPVVVAMGPELSNLGAPDSLGAQLRFERACPVGEVTHVAMIVKACALMHLPMPWGSHN